MYTTISVNLPALIGALVTFFLVLRSTLKDYGETDVIYLAIIVALITYCINLTLVYILSVIGV